MKKRIIDWIKTVLATLLTVLVCLWAVHEVHEVAQTFQSPTPEEMVKRNISTVKNLYAWKETYVNNITVLRKERFNEFFPPKSEQDEAFGFIFFRINSNIYGIDRYLSYLEKYKENIDNMFYSIQRIKSDGNLVVVVFDQMIYLSKPKHAVKYYNGYGIFEFDKNGKIISWDEQTHTIPEIGITRFFKQKFEAGE